MMVSGLFSFSNWETLAKGPKPLDLVWHGWISKTSSLTGVAGEHLRAGEAVYVKNGKLMCCTAEDARPPMGIVVVEVHENGMVKLAERVPLGEHLTANESVYLDQLDH